MKLSAKDFKNRQTIEITDEQHTGDMPSVFEVTFQPDRWDRVVCRLDGEIIGVHERFTFANSWLQKQPDFDMIIQKQ